MFFARNLIVSCVTQFVWICVLRWRSVSGRVSSIIPPVAGGFKRPIALKFDTSPAAAIKQCIIIIIIILFNRTLSPYSHTYRYSITHSLFHSRLKSFLFCKSSPLQPFLFSFRIHYMDFPYHSLLLLAYPSFYFLVFFCFFTLFSCRFRAVD